MRNYKYLFTQVANTNCIYQYEYASASGVINRIKEDYCQRNESLYAINFDFVVNRIHATGDCVYTQRITFRRDDSPEVYESNVKQLKEWYDEESQALNEIKVHFPLLKGQRE